MGIGVAGRSNGFDILKAVTTPSVEKWYSRKPQSSGTSVLPTRGADISMLSMGSSLGTVLNAIGLQQNCDVALSLLPGLASGTINVRMAAVRRSAYEAVDCGLLSPELAAGIHRVKGARKLGSRLGNWLTRARRRRSGRSPIDKLLPESVIERSWPSCSVADCDAASLRS